MLICPAQSFSLVDVNSLKSFLIWRQRAVSPRFRLEFIKRSGPLNDVWACSAAHRAEEQGSAYNRAFLNCGRVSGKRAERKDSVLSPRDLGSLCNLNMCEILADAGLWSKPSNDTDLGKINMKQTVTKVLGDTGGFAQRPRSTPKQTWKNMTSLKCHTGVFLYSSCTLDNEGIPHGAIST